MSRGRRLRRAFFRERHGHVAARDAEVVGAVGPVVVGAVALCGRGGEGEREDAEEEEAQDLREDVVDENIDVVDDQSEVVDDQKDDEEPPESPRRGKWWGFSCRGELQGDDRAADRRRRRGPVREVQRRRGRRQRRGPGACAGAGAGGRAATTSPGPVPPPRGRAVSAAVDADLATGGPGRSRRSRRRTRAARRAATPWGFASASRSPSAVRGLLFDRSCGTVGRQGFDGRLFDDC